MARARKQIISRGLIETIVCALIGIGLSWWMETAYLLAVWSALGWSQMMRTKASVTLALRWYFPLYRSFVPVIGFLHKRFSPLLTGELFDREKREERWASKINDPAYRFRNLYQRGWLARALDFSLPLRTRFPFNFLLLLAIALVFLAVWAITIISLIFSAFAVRIAATAVVAICSPGKALAAIPRNWRRVGFETTVFSPLEIVPRMGLLLRISQRLRGESLFNFFSRFQFFERRRFNYISGSLSVGCLVLAAILLLLTFYAFEREPTPLLESKIGGGAQVSLLEAIEDSDQDAFNHADDLQKWLWSRIGVSAFRADLASGRVQEMGFNEWMFSSHKQHRPIAFDPWRWRDWSLWTEYFASFPIRSIGDSFISNILAVGCKVFLIALQSVIPALYFCLWALILYVSVLTPLRVVFFLPTIAYRLSMKASALTYAPLFFVVEGPYVRSQDPLREFRKVRDDPWSDTQRAVAKLSAFFLFGYLLLSIFSPIVNKWIGEDGSSSI